MERPIKGGYILISLGLIALSTSYSGSIDYDRISKTKKHIVLTGIKVADTVMPDITVKPIYGNGTITFEDVYGFDIVVSSNNSVSVSEHVAPSGGLKLYKHTITGLSNGEEVVIISNKSNSFSFSTVGEEQIITLTAGFAYIMGINSYGSTYSLRSVAFGKGFSKLDLTTGQYTEITISSGVDTVTEL